MLSIFCACQSVAMCNCLLCWCNPGPTSCEYGHSYVKWSSDIKRNGDVARDEIEFDPWMTKKTYVAWNFCIKPVQSLFELFGHK